MLIAVAAEINEVATGTVDCSAAWGGHEALCCAATNTVAVLNAGPSAQLEHPVQVKVNEGTVEMFLG